MIEPRDTNIKKRISELETFIRYNQDIKRETERLLNGDTEDFSFEQIEHLVNKINIASNLIQQPEQEMEGLKGLI